MLAEEVFLALKKHGQMLDLDIAAAIGIAPDEVRTCLAEMSARGEIFCCNVTRFPDGEPVQALQCRISGYMPPPASGRKPSKVTEPRS